MTNIALPDTGFLSGASNELKRVLGNGASEIQLAPGQILFEQGDAGDALFVVGSGALEISVLSMNGRKLSLDLMGAGAIFGEIALFDPGPRTATVTALKPSRVLRLRNADVLRALRDHPELSADMLRLAGKRMRWMGKQLNEQVFLPLSTRLARKLLYLAPEDRGRNTPLSLSQAELAEYVGATREAVSKTLSTWKKAGVIDASRGELTILDRQSLEALAEPDEI